MLNWVCITIMAALLDDQRKIVATLPSQTYVAMAQTRWIPKHYLIFISLHLLEFICELTCQQKLNS